MELHLFNIECFDSSSVWHFKHLCLQSVRCDISVPESLSRFHG